MREEALHERVYVHLCVALEHQGHIHHRQTQCGDRALTRIDQPQTPAPAVLHMIELVQRRIVLHGRNRRQQPMKIRRRARHLEVLRYLDRRVVRQPPATGGQIASTSPSTNRVAARSPGGTKTPFSTTSLTSAGGMPSGATIVAMVAIASTSIGMAWPLRNASGR